MTELKKWKKMNKNEKKWQWTACDWEKQMFATVC